MMARNYLGKNEKAILKSIKALGNPCKRYQLISLSKTETGTSRDSLNWSFKNMVEKGLLIYESLSDTVQIPDHWIKVFNSGHDSFDLVPQQLISVTKRMEIMKLALESLSLNPVELYGLYGLLDLTADNLKQVCSLFTDKTREKGSKEFDTLAKAYLSL